MHTSYSDGADTLDAMVAACCALGLRVHRHYRSFGARRRVVAPCLAPGPVASAGRDRSGSANDIPQITILHGIEVDIMPDGSLDFPDRVLESLDIVLASLHESARHDGKTLTRRCLQAIRHPLVNVDRTSGESTGRTTGRIPA